MVRMSTQPLQNRSWSTWIPLPFPAKRKLIFDRSTWNNWPKRVSRSPGPLPLARSWTIIMRSVMSPELHSELNLLLLFCRLPPQHSHLGQSDLFPNNLPNLHQLSKPIVKLDNSPVLTPGVPNYAQLFLSWTTNARRRELGSRCYGQGCRMIACTVLTAWSLTNSLLLG